MRETPPQPADPPQTAGATTDTIEFRIGADARYGNSLPVPDRRARRSAFCPSITGLCAPRSPGGPDLWGHALFLCPRMGVMKRSPENGA